jgi:hypothetical protein
VILFIVAGPPLDFESAQRLNIQALNDNDLLRLAESIRSRDLSVQSFVMEKLEVLSLSGKLPFSETV